MSSNGHITSFEIGPYDRIHLYGVEVILLTDGEGGKVFERKERNGLPLIYSDEKLQQAHDENKLVVERDFYDPRRNNDEGKAAHLQDMCPKQQSIVAFKLRWVKLLEWKRAKGRIPHLERRRIMFEMRAEYQATYHDLRAKNLLPNGRLTYETSVEPSFDVPSYAAVSEWALMLKRAGGDARVLRDHRGEHERESSFTLEEQHLQGHFVWRFLSMTKPNRSYLFKLMKAVERRLNKERPDGAKLDLGGRSTYYNRIAALPDFAKVAARDGDAKAAAKYNVVIGKDRGHPMDLVEVDECRLDITTLLKKAKVWTELSKEVQEAYRKASARLWFSAAIDHATTAFVGARLHVQSPSIATARATLEMTTRDKTLTARNAGCKSDWNLFGGYRGVRLDGAAWNTSDAMLLTVTDAGGDKFHPPVKAPWLRGTMERLFGTLGGLTLQHFSGRTFSDIVTRGDRNPKKEASVDIEMLEKVLLRAIVDIHHHTPNKGKLGGMTPIQAWRAGCQNKKPPQPPSGHLRRTLYGVNAIGKITPQGIRWAGFYYQSEKAQKMRRNRTDVPVHIRIDVQDVSEISLYDGELSYPVPARLPALKGLSFWHATALLQELRCIDAEYTSRTSEQADEAREWIDSQAELARIKHSIATPIVTQKHLDRLEARITQGISVVEESEFTYEVSRQDWSESPFFEHVSGLNDEPEVVDDLDLGKDQTPEAVEAKYASAAKEKKKKADDAKALARKANASPSGKDVPVGSAPAAPHASIGEASATVADTEFSVRYFDEH
ncbi:hypothetical protein ELH22_08680 [Rhizobium ruizarguesonis]|uniref:Mu transposase C-terminal domain-containing protein n=1 Tax=Rhizobium ruizarguesonis TaxID=2081791 RepID=UPI00102FCF8B|nr:Mu transposase C-terminal domain-containing protein [Rhizobium ruizarguesonis]TBD63405.1 hypothetical protein ELH22_08680 [Rhizobium ruizarguesonis]